jgi:hypothetical protein
MYYDQRYDLPLRPRSDPLQAYLSPNDLPRQLPPNAYAHDRPHHTKSISRCAVTEISTHYEPDDSSFTPSQPLFATDPAQTAHPYHPYHPATQPTEIKEATFKPSDLQQLLREGRSNPSLKQMLVDNVFSRSRNEAGRRVATQHNEKRQQSKTKYERILEEYFNRKPKQESKNRISIDTLPNYRIQHLPNTHADRPEDSSKLQYLKELDQLSREATHAVLSHCRTARSHSLNTHPHHPTPHPHLRKTFSNSKMPNHTT